MRNPINMDPGYKITTMIPMSVKAKLDLYNYSLLEQGIPAGAISRFVKERIIEFFESEALDLAPYIPGVPSGTLSIRGTKAAIEALKHVLESR